MNNNSNPILTKNERKILNKRYLLPAKSLSVCKLTAFPDIAMMVTIDINSATAIELMVFFSMQANRENEEIVRQTN